MPRKKRPPPGPGAKRGYHKPPFHNVPKKTPAELRAEEKKERIKEIRAIRLRSGKIHTEESRDAVKQLFLDNLRDTKLNAAKAARMAGINSTGLIYNWRKSDMSFAMAWEEIESEILDELEEQQFIAALEDPKGDGQDRRFVLRARRGERWGSQRNVNVSGQVVISDPTRASTEELEAFLKEHGHALPKRVADEDAVIVDDDDNTPLIDE